MCIYSLENSQNSQSPALIYYQTQSGIRKSKYLIQQRVKFFADFSGSTHRGNLRLPLRRLKGRTGCCFCQFNQLKAIWECQNLKSCPGTQPGQNRSRSRALGWTATEQSTGSTGVHLSAIWLAFPTFPTVRQQEKLQERQLEQPAMSVSGNHSPNLICHLLGECFVNRAGDNFIRFFQPSLQGSYISSRRRQLA